MAGSVAVLLQPARNLEIARLADLNAAVEDAQKALRAQLVEQLGHRHARAADDGADFILRVVHLEIVPLAVNQRGGVGHGAEQALEPVLAGIEGEVLDLVAQDLHLARIAGQNRIAERLALVHQAVVHLRRDHGNRRILLCHGVQPRRLMERARRLAEEPPGRQGIERLLGAVHRHHVVARAAVHDIVHAVERIARHMKHLLGRDIQSAAVGKDQLFNLSGDRRRKGQARFFPDIHSAVFPLRQNMLHVRQRPDAGNMIVLL